MFMYCDDILPTRTLGLLPECVAKQDNLSSCTSTRLGLSFVLGLLILCSVSAAWRALSRSFYVSFPSLFVGDFVSHFETRWCYISTTSEPRSISTAPYIWERGCGTTEKYSNFSQRELLLFNIFLVWHMNTYIQTYIHTDSACIQHVNVGLAQAQANYIWLYVCVAHCKNKIVVLANHLVTTVAWHAK